MIAEGAEAYLHHKLISQPFALASLTEKGAASYYKKSSPNCYGVHCRSSTAILPNFKYYEMFFTCQLYHTGANLMFTWMSSYLDSIFNSVLHGM